MAPIVGFESEAAEAPGGRATVRVEAHPPEAMDPTVVQRLKSYQRKIRACADKEFETEGYIGGSLTVRWSIEDGAVSDVWIGLDTTGSATLITCIQRAVMTFRFPPETTSRVGSCMWEFRVE